MKIPSPWGYIARGELQLELLKAFYIINSCISKDEQSIVDYAEYQNAIGSFQQQIAARLPAVVINLDRRSDRYGILVLLYTYSK